MPKDTFYNLPEEKRKLIEDIAITEFASNGYDKASINTIVQNSGIAKGSFYQYFEDKKDLFLHILVDVASQRKIQYMSPVLMNPEGIDFFIVLKELYISGLRFASENPELEKLGMWLVNNTNHPIYDALFNESEHFTTNIYTQMLTAAAERGELRSDIDIDFIGYLFPTLISRTMDYCLSGMDGGRVTGVSEISDEILKKVDLMIDFLRSGIGLDPEKRRTV